MPSAVTKTAETYEEIRQRNIAANRSLLLSLQLSGPGLTPNLIPKSAAKNSTSATQSGTSTPRKTRKKPKRVELLAVGSEQSPVNGEGRRRSGRILNLISNQNKAQKDESSEESSEDDDEDHVQDSEGSDGSDGQENQALGRGTKRKSVWHPPQDPKRARGAAPLKRKAKSLKGSRPNPKVFGHQIGTEVGDWWDSRMMCSQAGVHAPPVCGIAGNDGVGCYSVALSGGYEDDVDLGYAFTFTGSGGRALSGTPGNPKNLRTAPQSSDQQFTAMNAALQLSCVKKNPVRVIRGYKNHSLFAPDEGYRYDGLYQVEKAWKEAGQSGFQVCKFAFVRLPNQPRIPVKEGREAEAEQMYQDMGFKLEDLPSPPEKRQPWSQSLAKQRKKEKGEALQITEDDNSKQDVQENPTDLSEKRHEEIFETDKPIHNGDLKDDIVDSDEQTKDTSQSKQRTDDGNLKEDVPCSTDVSQDDVSQEREKEDAFNSVEISNDRTKKNTPVASSPEVCKQRENENNSSSMVSNEKDETENGDLNISALDSVNVPDQSEIPKAEIGDKHQAHDDKFKEDVPTSNQPVEEKGERIADIGVQVDGEDLVEVGKQDSSGSHEQINGDVKASQSADSPSNPQTVIEVTE